MIFDTIDNSGLYTGEYRFFERAFEILRDTELINRPSGRHEVCGEDMFYIIDRYCTEPVEDGRFEAHNRYIDIQFLVSGAECIGYSQREGANIHTSYDENKDIEFYERPTEFTSLLLRQGSFCIFFAGELHMPGRSVNGQAGDVHKVVVKIKS